MNKQNISKMLEGIINKMNQEVKLFKQLNSLKNQRHGGGIIKKGTNSIADLKGNDVYDWIIDIDLITKIYKEGWKITFSD